MYKAIEEIGGYHIGDEVPREIAEVWAKQYKKSPVEQVQDCYRGEEPKVPEVETESVPEVSNDTMLDDYLARGKNVVKKNILSDNLDKDQLQKLLVMEKSGKNRSAVIEVIENKLNI